MTLSVLRFGFLLALVSLAAVLAGPVAISEAAPKVQVFSVLGPGQPNAHNGFEITVSATKRDGSARVYMTAHSWTKGDVVFSAPGKVSGKRIKANFGTRGKVNIRLREIKKNRYVSYATECGPRAKVAVRHRSYRASGRVVFRGEEGFTRTNKKLEKGKKKFRLYGQQLPKRVADCTAYADDSEPDLEDGFVELSSTGPVDLEADSRGGDIQLSAIRATGVTPYSYSVEAAVTETHGNVGVVRFTPLWVEDFNPNMFLFNSDLSEGALFPGAPFSGRADFVRTGPTAGSFIGDLTVGFPGRPGTPLAGLGLATDLMPAQSHHPQLVGRPYSGWFEPW